MNPDRTDSATATHPDVAEAVAGELRLMDPAVRDSRDLSARLLDPEFVEIGASGHRWTHDEILAALPAMSGATDTGSPYEPGPVTGVLLAPGLVHLTYDTVHDGRRAHRSSLWRRHPEAGDTSPLRMYFHQATPVPEPTV
ncbi:DUF4440 domain-containing protein [Streptomyces sp. NPDC059491]|uniref:nuclear transport factor 2 family protein n=1 Tax=unclassified Streptomyces TaxID=2593676 RepID=UPI0036754311